MSWQAPVPQFVGDRSCNVTFVVDVSEETRAALPAVKQLLVQTLLAKASRRDSLFNIVAFCGEPSCWSPLMRPCSPDSVYMSLSWIRSLRCGPGRDLLSGLSLAFGAPCCHAVHLLCSGLPDRPRALLAALPALAAGRPVHVFRLQDSEGRPDRGAADYLQGLSRATGGRCWVVQVGVDGGLEEAFPPSAADKHSSVSPAMKSCCSSSSLFIPSGSSASLRCSLGNPCVLAAPEFFPGCRVLARKEADGFYYPGTVTQQGRGGLWLVDLDPPAASGFSQLVCSLDMLKLSGAQTRRLVAGDAVLSPWEPGLRRYGPGRVMGAEHRDGLTGVGSVRVLMWNSCVSLVPVSLVLQISAPHHDRIVRELQTQTPGGCCSWPSARCSSCPPPPLPPGCCSSSSGCCSSSSLQPRLVPSSFREMEEKQLDVKDADVGRSDPEVLSSSSSFSSSSSSCSLPEDESGPKPSSKQQRPPWRYWRRTGLEPQHRQPGLQRRTSRPASSSFPAPQRSASPNHSSLFQSLPAARGRRANIREVFGTTGFKPRPPAGLRPSSHNDTAAVHT